MSNERDFVVFAAKWFLDQKVSTYDESGILLPDDGSYQRRGSAMLYIFAEFLRSKQLVHPHATLKSTAELQLMWSDLNDIGKSFVKTHFDKWVQANDRPGSADDQAAARLEKRWQKFVNSQA